MPDSSTIDKVIVTLNVQCWYPYDLEMSLIAPDNSSIVLIAFDNDDVEYEDRENFVDTVLDQVYNM